MKYTNQQIEAVRSIYKANAEVLRSKELKQQDSDAVQSQKQAVKFIHMIFNPARRSADN